MKVLLKNIGVFKQAEYSSGELTLICGENNTGKTYATYSLYGFYDFWKNGYNMTVAEKDIAKLMESGTVTIPLKTTLDEVNQEIFRACEKYSNILSRIFAAQEKYFKNASFLLTLQEEDISIPDKYSRSWRTPKSEMLQISKESAQSEISVSLILDKLELDSLSMRANITKAIGESLKEIIFGNTFPDIFIASAERTGAVIFKEHLNIEQYEMFKAATKSTDVDLNGIISSVYNSKYALPVKRNLDFIRDVENIAKLESGITKKYPDLLDDFSDMIGGEYKVGRDGLYYVPKSGRIKLTMGESSSSVRSMMDIGFYLRHLAEKGDMLMIDEPELNLHPATQRRFARLMVRLVHCGIKVFITTHSDYIVKELNTLIMLYNRREEPFAKQLMTKYKYRESELISHDKIKVFISDKDQILLDGNKNKTTIQTLIPADIDPFYGIEARSFDKIIEEMNHIQESIILGKKS